ncbi:MAG: hypothetical protein O3A55_00460 [Bacteroidetes bacterium]|nr:hypothetical protein [Bacteroidota bacterium]
MNNIENEIDKILKHYKVHHVSEELSQKIISKFDSSIHKKNNDLNFFKIIFGIQLITPIILLIASNFKTNEIQKNGDLSIKLFWDNIQFLINQFQNIILILNKSFSSNEFLIYASVVILLLLYILNKAEIINLEL